MDQGGLSNMFDEMTVSEAAPTASPIEEDKKSAAGSEATAAEDQKEQLTTDPDRKLAFLAKIEKLEPIKASTTIELATVLGWTVVVKKDEFKVGDLCVYFTIGAVPDPMNPAFDFLKVGGKMKELKSKKIKGVLSQGAIVPITVLKDYGIDATKLKIGDDVSKETNTKKAVSEEEADVYADLPEKEAFPEFVPQTDEERIQNIPEILKEVEGLKVVITRKEDGCSSTYAWNKGRFYPCSRNNVWNKKTKASSQVYRIAEKYKIKEGLEKLGRNIAIQGEIVGPSMCNNRLNLKDLEFRVFNIYDIDDQLYLGYDEITEICTKLKLQQVPLLYSGIFPKEWKAPEDLLKHVENLEYYPGCPAEGMVIKSDMGKKEKRISFKAVSNKYLTHFKL